MSIFRNFFAINEKPSLPDQDMDLVVVQVVGAAAILSIFGVWWNDTTSRSGKTIRTFNSSGSFTIQCCWKY